MSTRHWYEVWEDNGKRMTLAGWFNHLVMVFAGLVPAVVILLVLGFVIAFVGLVGHLLGLY